MKIKVLTKDIADKIAAGEVIEQPLSVVKELVENSIDACSSLITVEIKNGGKTYIRVSDNGCGIDKDDIKTAFLPHATSKISTEDDLDNIISLGFRGEALTSIAAVSKLELITKTTDSKIGNKISIEASEITAFEESACETGTTIIVKDIFYNLPARQKFMKSDSREASLITDFVSKISICYPKIKFRLINNGNILFSTTGKGDVYNTILTVYNAQNAKKLLPVDFENSKMKIKGFVSSPLESKQNRKQQIYFVNGRLVSSKLIDNAISMAYEDKLFEGRFPSTYLFIEIDPSTIDVNIHPRKADIKFQDEEAVRDFIIFGIRRALLNQNALKVEHDDIKDLNNVSISENKSNIPVIKLEELHEDKSNDFLDEMFEKKTESFIPSIDIVQEEKNSIFKALRENDDKPELKTEQLSVLEDTKEFKSDRFLFNTLTPLCQLFVTYILAVNNDNFYIIDQHAAHERIMYEKILSSFNNDDVQRQALLTPFVIDLDKASMLASIETLPILDGIGFSLEEFGPSSYIVKEIPAYLDMTEANDFVKEFFDSADEYKDRIQIRKELIISRSCKSAVKAHDKLSIAEMKQLFIDLDKCENPFSCPHGRPTFLKFSEYELERMFKRK